MCFRVACAKGFLLTVFIIVSISLYTHRDVTLLLVALCMSCIAVYAMRVAMTGGLERVGQPYRFTVPVVQDTRRATRLAADGRVQSISRRQ